MRIVSVVGTRPQLIKAAALQPALRRAYDEVFVDTGQHWDDAMAGAFFRELGLARPDHALGAGGGGHAEQTAAMLRGLEPILLRERPDAVLVYGDTNSTLSGSLAAAKLGIPVAHVEAGLRSFDRRMPEELNRIVADHVSTWLFAPTATAVANLAAEGLRDGVTLVGDLMQDLAARTLPHIREAAVLDGIERELQAAGTAVHLESGGYVFATVHRQANREPGAIDRWAAVLGALAHRDRPVVLALHPGTRAALQASGTVLGRDVVVIEPQSYRTSLALQLHAAAVVTDSGGVQREAAWLGVPCLVLRTTTEWPEVVDGRAAALIGLDAAAARAALTERVPLAESAELARQRAASASLDPAGAADAIVLALSRPVGVGGS
ncbi:MAG TPA: UDP-N-acetylglucosamine 2-epimerase (non-hydrolyzing) [Candidatus Limnocylindrales bacterium]